MKKHSLLFSVLFSINVFASHQKIKIILIRSTNTGKTSLLNYLCYHTYSPESTATIGLDVKFLSYKEGDKIKEVTFCDSSGLSRFRTIVDVYTMKADGAFLVYDMSNADSFDFVVNWLQRKINDGFDFKKLKLVLVGNKKDLSRKRIIQKEDGLRLANAVGIPFFEVSVKTGSNLEESFQKLVASCDKSS